ncbi:MAG: dTDP-4-dehydrorhamnose 3,5-epimerase [Alloprevotella sp.]|nr:dTDP-4-dehydrorhamnose 3,5-epimerase [Alloprevotella sp.]MBR1445551.1 dTDP-4-dehydrorhamnose 3,5-epimerase [Alloprevotella sp.]
MEFQQTGIAGVVVATPRVFEDGRGYFMETWREELLNEALGYPVRFVQDNESRSVRGVLRGLHYQRGAASQAKLVRVLQGEVYDVAVDLRVGSPTFGHYVGVRLSGENHRQLFVPRGFAHGFQVLSDVAVFAYKVDNRYAPETEASIRYDDPDLAIDWPLKEGLILSDKDLQRAVSFAQAEKFG